MRKFIYTLMALMMFGGMKCSAQTVSGQVAGHDYVDLGLPSGSKWATYNVGATKPTEYGDYISWGETKPKVNYEWSTYKWTTDGGKTFTKYNTFSKNGTIDSLMVLEYADDAATANWGSAWRMPTTAELEELIDGCDWKWINDYNGSGVNGQLGTSKANGNTIFLPAAGHRHGSDLYYAGSFGGYWSSSLRVDYSYFAYYLNVNERGIYWFGIYRNFGLSVRAVCEK